MRSAEELIDFWFERHGQDDWFGARPEFDAACEAEFAETHEAVSRGEAYAWRRTAAGRLAEIILLDQFSRQLHRGSPRAFAQDGMALALAQEAVAQGVDTQLPNDRRMFLYMPFMHSESIRVHEEQSVPLFATLGLGPLQYEQGHLDVLRRFGRYPMRNAALGRASTPEEAEYIAGNSGSMF